MVIAAALSLSVTAPAEGGKPMAAPTDAELAALVRRTPDVRMLAIEKARRAGSLRHDEVQAELAAGLVAERKTYVQVEPYRSPPRPCSTREHMVAIADVTVFDPSGPERPRSFTFTERELHEAEHHRAALTPEQRSFLLAALAKR